MEEVEPNPLIQAAQRRFNNYMEAAGTAGGQPVHILSPKIFSILPEYDQAESAHNNTKEKLKNGKDLMFSPNLLSFHDQGFLPMPSLELQWALKQRSDTGLPGFSGDLEKEFSLIPPKEKSAWLELLLEVSGAGRLLNRLLQTLGTGKLTEIEQEMYPAVQRLENLEERSKRLIENQSADQRQTLDTQGYVLLTDHQTNQVFGINQAGLGNLSEQEMEQIIEEDIWKISRLEGAFVPVILSPRAAIATALSPSAFTTFILTPAALTVDMVTRPSAFWFNLLSPLALNAFILSPSALGAQVLSPRIFSLSVASPSSLTVSILSPNRNDEKVTTKAIELKQSTKVAFSCPTPFQEDEVFNCGKTVGWVLQNRPPNSVRFSGGKLVKIDVVRSALQHYRSTQSKSRPVSSMHNRFGFVASEEDLKKLRQFERGEQRCVDRQNQLRVLCDRLRQQVFDMTRGIVLHDCDIQAMTIVINRELQIPRFSASLRWVQNFKSGSRIVSRHITRIVSKRNREDRVAIEENAH
uniref:HTH CENPB-type domain-containing protein n=1 Tax=Ditylenchus dipsaci TaxID=166011 RepID=A0A915DCP5_9BILA